MIKNLPTLAEQRWFEAERFAYGGRVVNTNAVFEQDAMPVGACRRGEYLDGYYILTIVFDISLQDLFLLNCFIVNQCTDALGVETCLAISMPLMELAKPVNPWARKSCATVSAENLT